MADVDKGNAHIRSSKRQSGAVVAAEARRLLDDPAFNAGIDRVRDGLVAELENIKHDGQPETDAYEREICRALRMLKSLTRSISLTVQGEAFKAHDISLVRRGDEG